VSVFGGKEFGGEHFARGIVQEAEQGKLWSAILEPAVQTGVEPDHFPFASAGAGGAGDE
jgi:hypothetical protein